MERPRKLRIALLLVLIPAIGAVSFAVWNSKRSIRHSKEAVLRQNLDTLRKTIDAYTYDKRKAPQSLQDLVTAGYLKRIPTDPITGRADWDVVDSDTMVCIDQTEPGINDLHSASEEISSEGTAYKTW